MKRLRALAGLAGLIGLSATVAQAEPSNYWLDPEHSFVHWEVLHFGTSTSHGRFGAVSGAVQIDRSAGRGSVSLRIATASVDTGLRPFDARLREPDLLASTAFPDAYFVATRLRFDGDRLAEVRGEFTLRGVSQPLSLVAKRFGCRNEARGEVCGGDFEAEILRSDFGMTYGLPWIANRVRLLVQVEGLRL
jgi:polyisoprenoid-binding protein YceI